MLLSHNVFSYRYHNFASIEVAVNSELTWPISRNSENSVIGYIG